MTTHSAPIIVKTAILPSATQCARNRLLPTSLTRYRVAVHRTLNLLILLLLLNTASADIVSNLTAAWPFNLGSGTDATGNGYDGTLQTVSPVADRNGNANSALQFNGSSSAIEVAKTFPMQNQQTFLAWVKPTASGAFQMIVEKAIPGYGGEVDFEMFLLADGTVTWQVNTDNGATGIFAAAIGHTALPLGQWSFVTGVIDQANNQVRLYINGVLDATDTMGGRNVRNGSRPIRFGKQVGNQATRYFNGALDEIKIFDRALVPAEILALKANTSDLLIGLGGWWKFHESLQDFSGNNNVPTVVGPNIVGRLASRNGAVLSSTSSGANQIQVPSSATLSAQTEMTISALVYVGNNGGFPNVISGPGFDIQQFGGNFFITVSHGPHPSFGFTSSTYNIGGLTPGAWTHVVLIKDAIPAPQGSFPPVDYRLRIYVNGVAAGGDDQTLGWTFPARPITVGGGMDGGVRDVRFWNRSLSAADVQAVFNQVNVGSVSGQVNVLGWAKWGEVRVQALGGPSATEVALDGPQTYSIEVPLGTARSLQAYWDINGNNTRDTGESLGVYGANPLTVTGDLIGINLTVPLALDTDGDGMPDVWEIAHGLNPLVNDAYGDLDNDGLPNIMEFILGTDPQNPDTDGDGLKDGDEYYIYGTNPLLADTDGDGIPDGWEVANGLNPLVNDANEDRDLDGLTNKEEYDLRAQGFKANSRNSLVGLPSDDHLSDYRRAKGEGWVHRYYDKNDRLIATERDNGTVQLYVYDANGQKVRDILLSSLNAAGDGIPDTWKFAHGLAISGPGAGTGDNGPNGDPDHDGFTNFQEWKAGTDPQDSASHPVLSSSSVSTVQIAPGFTPTNWVMATGQLDGFGPDEVVVGADGNVGSTTNNLQVLTRGDNGWTAETASVGNVGINSIAVGELEYGGAPRILLGGRPASGAANILTYSKSGAVWVQDSATVANGINALTAQLIGLSVSGRPLTLASTSAQPGLNCYIQDWQQSSLGVPAAIIIDSARATWPIVRRDGGMAIWLNSDVLRLFDSTALSAPPASIRRTPTTSRYLVTPTDMTWGAAEQYAVSQGGHLATIEDSTENNFVRAQFRNDFLWLGIYRDMYTDAANSASWKWLSNLSSGFRNWSAGSPLADYQGPYGDRSPNKVLIAPDGKWLTTTGITEGIFGPYGTPNPGLVEVAASSSATDLMPTAVSNRLVWRGRSLAYGPMRNVNSSGGSLVYASIDKRSAGSGAGVGDDFVVGEYDTTSATPTQRTLNRIPVTITSPSGAYGLTFLRNSDVTKPGTLAVGEPDGTVSLWTAGDATSPLVRKVFTTAYLGKTWHQLEPLREADGREGLVGLLVDPANPAQCQVIHWMPEMIDAALSGTTPVQNTLPVARVLAPPVSGGHYSVVSVRAWDAEADFSAMELQYQRAGEFTWTAAKLRSADGTAVPTGSTSTPLIATAPTGTSHSLLWDAVGDLGTGLNTSVLLRTRATDSQTGEWSSPMSFAVNTTSAADTDHDGLPDAWEIANGLNPNSAVDALGVLSGDGVSNLIKYALALNPRLPAINALPLSSIEQLADGQHLTLTYRRRKGAALNYIVERSAALSDWQSGPSVLTEAAPVDNGDGTETCKVWDRLPMDSTTNQRAFLRLKVAVP